MEIAPWMLEAVDYYQRLDFFTWGSAGPALKQALSVHEARWGHPPKPPSERWTDRDVGVLELDEERVLFLDFEIAGIGGHNMYEPTIRQLARITRGVFSAWDIREEALDHERYGPVRLTFRVGTDSHEFEVCGGNGDWLDPRLLWIVDDFLRVSPYRLHAAAASVGSGQRRSSLRSAPTSGDRSRRIEACLSCLCHRSPRRPGPGTSARP